MADDTSESQRDWLIPAVVVAVGAVVVLIVVIIFAVQANDDRDDTVAGQLERWSSCLRSEGANVPLVEALRDGGFRVTVDGSLVEEGMDFEALSPALESCKDDAPEAVQDLMSVIDGLSDLPFLDFGDFNTDTFSLQLSEGLGPRTLDDAPRRPRSDRRSVADICEQLQHGDIDSSDIPRRILEACKRLG